MADDLSTSFSYEHCDVPEGQLLSEWRPHIARDERRAQLAGGFFAALATLAPMLISVRGSRRR